MSKLLLYDLPIFDSLFDMADGYVLEINSKEKFKNLIQNIVNLDIYNSKYEYFGTSMAKRLRKFILIEPDLIVGKVLSALINYKENLLLTKGGKTDNLDLLIKKAKLICNDLLGKQSELKIDNENDLISYQFENLSIEKLSIHVEAPIINILNQRINEIKICLNNRASLACIFLCGSTLEGILLGIATKRIKDFNQSKASPRDKLGNVQLLTNWTLNNFIDVSHNLGLIDLNVKNYSHSLRDFRNYIHPHAQLTSKFNPDVHTAKLSWAVLQLAISQLTK